jgi:nucleoside triphosphate diphosphatase
VSESSHAIDQLLQVMRRLRDPKGGCPWDREQTLATIAPYTIEEAYEVADAIERNDAADLKSELGDLLFQVVFHARLAEECGWFDFEVVAASIRDKLVRRHPHVFGDTVCSDAAQQTTNWEEHKARERAEAAARRSEDSPGVLADVPKALPALLRAAKLGRRAARIGFDWPDATGVRAKLDEELAEVDEAIAKASTSTPGERAATAAAVAEEIGDALFTLVNLGRHLDVDAEEALRAANAKFEARFRQMEALARARQLDLKALTPGAWDSLWLEAKGAPKP